MREIEGERKRERIRRKQETMKRCSDREKEGRPWPLEPVDAVLH